MVACEALYLINALARATKQPLAITNPARHSNWPTLCLRSDHYDRRRAIRSRVFSRHTPEPRAGENAVPRFRLFPPAKRLLARAALFRLPCCRDPVGSATQPDLPTATGSTSQIDAGSFFSNDAATTKIYTLSLHDALPKRPRAPP